MNLFTNDDDFMNISPEEKLFEIISVANQTVVQAELQKIFDKYIAMESMLESQLGEEELEKQLNAKIYDPTEEFRQEQFSFAMTLMSQIASQAE